MAKAILESGVLRAVAERYELTGPWPPLALPATLQESLMARLDRLGTAKGVAQLAATIGRQFPYAVLHAVAPMDAPTLQHALHRLMEAELLYQRGIPPHATYRFKHALIQEVAAQSLLRSTQQEYHQRIAQVLEAQFSDMVATHPQLLASHYTEAGLPAQALGYWRQAGAKALAESAYREAVGCFEQALEALAHLPIDRTTREQAIDLRCDLSMALLPLVQWEQTLTHLRAAEPLAEGLADHRRLGRVCRRIANTLRNMQDYEPALAYCQRAHAMATTHGDVGLQIMVTNEMGWIYYELGDYRQAMEYLQQNLTALQGVPPDQSFRGFVLPSVLARVLMVQCLSELGAFADGVAYGDEARQIAEAVDRPYERLAVYSRVGILHVRQGTLHQAIPVLDRAVALSQEADIPNFSRTSTSYLALAYALAGRAADALPVLEQVGGNTDSPPIHLPCGEAYLRAGCGEEADHLAQRALANARARKRRGQKAWALWLLGEIAMRRDPPDVVPAATHYQQALALAEDLGMRPLQAHCHLGLGTLYAMTCQFDNSYAALSTAIALYRTMEMTFWLPQAEAALAQVEGRE